MQRSHTPAASLQPAREPSLVFCRAAKSRPRSDGSQQAAATHRHRSGVGLNALMPAWTGRSSWSDCLVVERRSDPGARDRRALNRGRCGSARTDVVREFAENFARVRREFRGFAVDYIGRASSLGRGIVLAQRPVPAASVGWSLLANPTTSRFRAGGVAMFERPLVYATHGC